MLLPGIAVGNHGDIKTGNQSSQESCRWEIDALDEPARRLTLAEMAGHRRTSNLDTMHITLRPWAEAVHGARRKSHRA